VADLAATLVSGIVSALPGIAKPRGLATANSKSRYRCVLGMNYDRTVVGNPAADTSENEP
jgi:hypothetical protein